MDSLIKRWNKFISFLMIIVFVFSICPVIDTKASSNNSIYDGQGYEVTFRIDNQWQDAFNATISIRNTGVEQIDNWALGFYLPYTITNISNGVIKSCNENYYVIKNSGYNQDITSGNVITFGFTAKCDNTVQFPTSYDLLTFKEKLSQEKFKVNFRITGSWDKTMNGELEIKNTSSETIEDWILEFESELNITRFWTSDIVSHNANHYVIKNSGYNSMINPGESLVLGFEGISSSGEMNASAYTLYQISTDSAEIVTPTITPTVTPTITLTPTVTISVTPTVTPSVTPTIDYELDTDGDELPDYVEVEIGSNPNMVDTDGDGLSDGLEHYLLGLNPISVDTNGDGILDNNEDLDQDGLTNIEELTLGTNPLMADTDTDSISDSDEVNIYHTNPIDADTDRDGLIEGDEIKLGLDPLKSDSDGNGIADNEEKIQQSITQDIIETEKPEITEVSITMNSTGYINSNTQIENMYNKDIMSSEVVGLIGVPIEIESSSSFDEATIIFQYDPTKLGDTNEEDLRVMWYDKDNNKYVIMDNESVVDLENNTVSYTTTHFSTYLVVDRKEWYEFWSNSILYRRQTTKKIPRQYYDFCFVVDNSVSMSGTRINTAKDMINKFVDAMYSNDRLAVIGYDDSVKSEKTVKIYQKFNLDKSNLQDILNDIGVKYNDKEGDWLTTSLDLIQDTPNWKVNSIENKKIIVVFSDGDINCSEETLKRAEDKGIKIYIVLVNSSYNHKKSQKITDQTGGDLYIAKTAEEVRKSIFGIDDESIGEVDPTDTDGDTLPDIYELGGMIGPNGKVYYTNPKFADTDGDDLSDAEEMGVICKYGEQPILKQIELFQDGFNSTVYAEYFDIKSDPNEVDTDGDGFWDDEDIKATVRTKDNMDSFYISDKYYVNRKNGKKYLVPETQDMDIMDNEDKKILLCLYMMSTHYFNKRINEFGENSNPSINEILIENEIIKMRKSDKYKGKYAFSDRLGECMGTLNIVPFGAQVFIEDRSINTVDKLWYSGVILDGISGILSLAVTDVGCQALSRIITLISVGMDEQIGSTDYGWLYTLSIKDTKRCLGVSAVLGIVDYFNTDISIGDSHIRICLHRGGSAHMAEQSVLTAVINKDYYPCFSQIAEYGYDNELNPYSK